jgi:DNA (cytosine-5)-methyltransferase 1
MGSKTDLEQMIGNAAPVKLAEFVAKIVLEYASKKESPSDE